MTNVRQHEDPAVHSIVFGSSLTLISLFSPAALKVVIFSHSLRSSRAPPSPKGSHRKPCEPQRNGCEPRIGVAVKVSFLLPRIVVEMGGPYCAVRSCDRSVRKHTPGGGVATSRRVPQGLLNSGNRTEFERTLPTIPRSLSRLFRRNNAYRSLIQPQVQVCQSGLF